MAKDPEKLTQEGEADGNPEIGKTTEALRDMAAAESARPEVAVADVVEDKKGPARELKIARNTIKKAFAEKEPEKPKSSEDYPEDIRRLGQEMLIRERDEWGDTKDMFKEMGGELKRIFYTMTGRSKDLPKRPETIEEELRQKLIGRLGPDNAGKAEVVRMYMDQRQREMDKESAEDNPEGVRRNKEFRARREARRTRQGK